MYCILFQNFPHCFALDENCFPSLKKEHILIEKRAEINILPNGQELKEYSIV
jgi:hypothetical protein